MFVIRRSALALVAILLLTRGTVSTETGAAAGSTSIDTADGDRIGRRALTAYTRQLDPLPPIDPDLDALARDQLRAAIAANVDSGAIGPHLLHPAPDVLVRIGVVSTAELDTRTNLFSLDRPHTATAFGSAGGEALLQRSASATPDSFIAQVAAVAWRDPTILDAPDELTATFGVPPHTQDELNAAAAQRWLDQENRDRQASNFPAELLAQRNPVLDREAENTMRRRFGETELPSLVDPTGQVAMDTGVHFTAYACSPNCDPFWTAPERVIDLLRQAPIEELAAQSVGRPELLDFQRYNSQLTWAVQLPRLRHYWNSYRKFGIATRVRLDQDVADGHDAARTAVNDLVPGGADLWDPREYSFDIVVVAYDPWPTDWHRKP